MELEIKINTHGNSLPEQHGEYIDLRCAEDVMMTAGENKIISLGVSMELPEGYYAEVAPRSSMFKNHGIIMTNSPGVIERHYWGDNDIWGLSAYATRDTFIPKGTRLCQFRLVKQAPRVKFVSVDKLGNPDRGGFGSTGKS